tara:strand:+ start:4696 stop:4950 length:255 start_codon:yes stop_codon:yes gene_type:complete
MEVTDKYLDDIIYLNELHKYRIDHFKIKLNHNINLNWLLRFTRIDGTQKEKVYKTFTLAKKAYDSYNGNMGHWYNIYLTPNYKY